MDGKKKIVFYSYKGGTGRTLALANVASYLARFEFKVCIVDMDLEAPGIHYKFFKKADIRTNSMLGVVDYIDYFVKNEFPPPDINPYLIRVNDNISIMPSGNVTCDDYWDKLSRINWHALLYEEDSSGVKLLHDLFGRIQNDELGFDYILIDARAGITPLSGLCVSLFGDVLASFFTASPDSLDGTRQMLMNVRKTRAKDSLPDIPIVSVLTRFEKFENINEEDAFIADKMEFLSDGEHPLFTEFSVIHADRDIERNERIVYGMSEDTEEDKLQVDVPIQIDYLRFFSFLVDDEKMISRIQSLLNKITDPISLINEPEKVQSEVEALSIIYMHKLVQEELIKIYILRNINLLEKDKFLSAITRYYDSGGSSKDIDQLYLDTFVHYFDNNPYREERFSFDFERLFRITDRASFSEKMQLALTLKSRYLDEYYNKAFELFVELLQNEQYSNQAIISILELFALKEDLYHEHTELLPDLNDSLIKEQENTDLREAAYNVYIMYCSQKNAVRLLMNSDFRNYWEKNYPLKLIESYFLAGDSNNAFLLAVKTIERFIRDYDVRGLAELVELFDERGQIAKIDPFLQKDHSVVKEALDMIRR